MGADVRYFDERPSNAWTEKAFIRFTKQLVAKRIEVYYKSILKQVEDFEPDYLLVVKGEVVPPFFLRAFKSSWPKAKKIFYHADSFLNNPNPLELLQYFNRASTFDSLDSKQYNLSYLPLFFDDYYLNQNVPFKDRKYDVSFIGTLHSDRAIFVQKVLRQFPENKKFVYYYTHGLLGLVYHIIKTRQISAKALRNVNFKALSTLETRQVFLNSKCVIDVEHPNQSGLTSRTIEALGAGCKLITTNNNIFEADFYNAKNILVLNRINPVVPNDFLNEVPVFDQEVRSNYALTKWLKTLFKSL